MHAVQAMGKRSAMEDRYILAPKDGLGLFVGVFDGHGGGQVADFLANHFPDIFFEALREAAGADEAFLTAFSEAERECKEEEIGSAAVCAFISEKGLTLANCGDSMGVVISDKAETLSCLHRLANLEERARVLAAGATVRDPYFFNRDRGLMPTRSFGDRQMRQVGLTARPHVTHRGWSAADRYVLLASDGLLDVLKDSEILPLLTAASGARETADRLLLESHGRGATDNVTVVVVEVI